MGEHPLGNGASVPEERVEAVDDAYWMSLKPVCRRLLQSAGAPMTVI